MKQIAIAALFLSAAACASAGDVTRYPLPNNSTFPIAQAVETSADTAIIYHSGTVPGPANPDAERNTREYWGDTEAQTRSVLDRIEASLENLGVGMGDVIKMTVFLVGDPELDGKMDFAGFMRAYTDYFGTEEQPNLPARSALQIAALANEHWLVEIEVIVARSDD